TSAAIVSRATSDLQSLLSDLPAFTAAPRQMSAGTGVVLSVYHSPPLVHRSDGLYAALSNPGSRVSAFTASANACSTRPAKALSGVRTSRSNTQTRRHFRPRVISRN